MYMTVSNMLSKYMSDIEINKYKKSKKCAICGIHDLEYEFINKIINNNFNNFEIFKFNTNVICKNCIKCLKNTYNNKCIRNFSVFVTENGIENLSKENIYNILISNKKTPFILSWTFSYKKHWFQYCNINNDNNRFIIGTDLGCILINLKTFKSDYGIYFLLREFGMSKEELFLQKTFKYNLFDKIEYNDYILNINKIKKFKNTLYSKFIISIL